jgi:2-amino-4-hydroxy-6-hydroxymethyldihydropteridine diphosphokinase
MQKPHSFEGKITAPKNPTPVLPDQTYIALGSNLGDRLANLQSAVLHLESLGRLTICSSVYETEPRDYTDQPWFLNAVIAIQTTIAPDELMRALLHIESQLGRDRRSDLPAKGPRVIDLDLLFHTDQVVHTDDLELPHPRLHERLFVLAPLNEIAPNFVHPVLKRTIRELHEEIACDQSTGVVRVFASPLC